jgi:uncharacterized membrane protein YpjA
LTRLLGQQRILVLLFIVNFFGTIYGYFWYKNQLLSTQWWLWPFVPDSPTASLFFTIALLAFLMRKKWRLLEAFAAVTLFKYGIWATVMILWTSFLGGELSWQHYMLIFSHLGMALQALLYSPYFTFKLKHLLIVATWTMTNDLLDYTLGIYPWLNYRLHPHLFTIYGFTISLSIISLMIFFITVVRRTRTIQGMEEPNVQENTNR